MYEYVSPLILYEHFTSNYVALYVFNFDNYLTSTFFSPLLYNLLIVVPYYIIQINEFI